MNYLTDDAIVLGRINFKESDRIITFLCKKNGKISVIAKGVRKQKSKLAGGVELLSISEIGFIKGKSEIYTLTSSRLIKYYSNIVKDINKTMLSYKFLNIVSKIADDDSSIELFELINFTLDYLNRFNELKIIESWFYLRLLKITGHSPNLNTDDNGNNLESKRSYNFDIESMCFVNSKFQNYSDKEIKLMRILIQSREPVIINRIENIEPSVENTVLKLCKNLYNFYVKV